MNQPFFRSIKVVCLAALLCAQVAGAQNLLINGDFSAGNSGFTSDYQFVPSGQSAAVGTYGIRASSLDFNSGYNSFADHTSGNGLMMLIDGSATAGTICWQESVAVTTN